MKQEVRLGVIGVGNVGAAFINLVHWEMSERHLSTLFTSVPKQSPSAQASLWW